jgi:hypothetical protein
MKMVLLYLLLEAPINKYGPQRRNPDENKTLTYYTKLRDPVPSLAPVTRPLVNNSVTIPGPRIKQITSIDMLRFAGREFRFVH